MKSCWHTLSVICFLLGSVAQAEFRSGQDIQSGLTNWFMSPTPDGKLVEAAVAFGYVIGVHDTLETITICSPANVTQGQINQIVLKYLNENPALLHQAADQLVNAALREVWPCAR